MLEQWYSLTLEPGPRPALVLDVSESAKPVWPVLRSLTEGVLEILPADTWPRIYFLGNPDSHPAAEFGDQAERWFQTNAGRGSIIAPIFEQLEAESDIAVVVAGNGVIFDLSDWKGHILAERTVWCRYGPASITGGMYCEDSYTVEQLAEKLHNPALRIEVSGPGMMPIYWSDGAFRWDAGKLVGEKTSGTLVFGIVAPDPECLEAAVLLSNGTRRRLPLVPVDPLLLPEWQDLPGKEDNLLRQCLRQGRYQCPQCGREHPTGQWRCTTAKSDTAFRLIEQLSRGGFCLVNTEPWQGRARAHPSRALQLGPECVAVRQENDKIVLVRYDARTNTWEVRPEHFGPLHAVVDKVHALVM